MFLVGGMGAVAPMLTLPLHMRGHCREALRSALLGVPSRLEKQISTHGMTFNPHVSAGIFHCC